MPKFNEIGPNEAAKMIVRGTLFSAPQFIIDQYATFIAPFSIGNHAATVLVSEEENNKLAKFVQELSSIPTIDVLALETCTPAEKIEIVKQQVNRVIAIANRYIKILEYYATDLETITSNIKSRKIVTYNMPVPSQMSEQGKSLKQSDETPHNSEYFRQSFIKALQENSTSEKSAENEKRENQSNKELEDFLENDDEPKPGSHNVS